MHCFSDDAIIRLANVVFRKELNLFMRPGHPEEENSLIKCSRTTALQILEYIEDAGYELRDKQPRL